MTRTLYFGMIGSRSYSQAIGEKLYIGAAAEKMGSVILALRIAGRRAWLISLPFPGTSARKANFPAVITHEDGFPALFLPVSRSPALRKLRGFWTFGIFAARRVRQDDIVLFYNHAAEYLLALIILRLRGVAVYQDIEDAPIAADRGLRGVLNRIGYRAMLALSSPRKVTVSEQLGRDMGLREFVAVQGVASQIQSTANRDAWMDLALGGPLRLHYGGSLMASTGLDLFCDMIEVLQTLPWADSRGVVFEVTGIGNFERLRELARGCPAGLRIEPHGTVDRDHYDAVLQRCHAGLSLKLPDEAVSSTTFPSKVIEITSRGLALVSSVVSDVAVIFDEDDAFLLHDLSSKTLAATICEMIADTEEVRRRAEAGQQVAQQRFAPAAVGARLAEFLEATGGVR